MRKVERKKVTSRMRPRVMAFEIVTKEWNGGRA